MASDTTTAAPAQQSLFQRVALNFAWTALAEVAAKSLNFITSVYLARTLMPDVFGLFALAQTCTLYGYLAVDLGTGLYGIREIAKDKAKALNVINPLFTLRLISGLAVMLVFWLSIEQTHLAPSSRAVFWGCSLFLLSQACITDWVFKGLEQFRWLAAGSLVTSSCALALSLAFVHTPRDVVTAACIWSLSALAGNLALMFVLVRRCNLKLRLCIDPQAWLGHLRHSAFFAISGGMMTIYQNLPLLVLIYLHTSHEAGLWSAPYRIVTMLFRAGFLVVIACFPVFSEMFQHDRRRFRRLTESLLKRVVVVGMVLSIAGWMLARPAFVKLVLGPSYEASTPVLQILTWLFPIFFARYVVATGLLASNSQRLHAFSSFCGVLTSLLVAPLAIFHYGITGAALTILCAEFVVLIAMLLCWRMQDREAIAKHDA